MNKSQVRRKSVQGAGSKSNLSMSTSRTSMSNRRQSRIDRTGLEKSEKSSATKIQVLGDDGRDVTPKVFFYSDTILRGVHLPDGHSVRGGGIETATIGKTHPTLKGFHAPQDKFMFIFRNLPGLVILNFGAWKSYPQMKRNLLF